MVIQNAGTMVIQNAKTRIFKGNKQKTKRLGHTPTQGKGARRMIQLNKYKKKNRNKRKRRIFTLTTAEYTTTL